MYDVRSKNPEEFINHEEILETLSYAEANKHNVELIDQIIAKAKERKGGEEKVRRFHGRYRKRYHVREFYSTVC